MRLLANVPHNRTIQPLLRTTIAPGTCIDTDAYDISRRLEPWGDAHERVCHRRGAYAREDDGDGFCDVQVHTLEGIWSLLRSWLRPHRGIAQEKVPLSWGFVALVHTTSRRGNALLGALLALLLIELPETRIEPKNIQGPLDNQDSCSARASLRLPAAGERQRYKS